MTSILAVGYAGGGYVQDQPSFHAFPEALERTDLERLADVVPDDLDRQRAVVAIYPSWWPEPSLRRLQTIRSAFESSHVLFHASALPPLAGSVLCGLAAAVAPGIRAPGVFVAGLPLLERLVLPVARLGSVSGLRHPNPSVWQHLASWWPHSSFAVSWWPRPGVRRLRRKDDSVPLPPPAGWTGVPLDGLAATGSWEWSGWLERAVARPLDVKTLVRVDTGPNAARFWGTHSVLEAAAYPTNVEALVSWLVEGHRVARCPWCGEAVVSQECPFCGMDRAAAFVPAVEP
jgi:hypothetical protein